MSTTKQTTPSSKVETKATGKVKPASTVKKAEKSPVINFSKSRKVNLSEVNDQLTALGSQAGRIKANLISKGYGHYLSDDLTGEVGFQANCLTKLSKSSLITDDQLKAMRKLSRFKVALDNLLA